MRKGQRLGEDVEQRRLKRLLAGAQARLDQLQVPVAKLGVKEVVERQRGV